MTAATLQSPRTSAALALAFVFLCGAAAGALTMNLIHAPAVQTKHVDQLDINRWKKELDLTDAQAAQLETILDDFSKYYHNVLADGRTRVMQILDERQKRKFEQMLKDNQPASHWP
jgi:Spy/CpxP family protein refolding chaperone